MLDLSYLVDDALVPLATGNALELNNACLLWLSHGRHFGLTQSAESERVAHYEPGSRQFMAKRHQDRAGLATEDYVYPKRLALTAVDGSVLELRPTDQPERLLGRSACFWLEECAGHLVVADEEQSELTRLPGQGAAGFLDPDGGHLKWLMFGTSAYFGVASFTPGRRSRLSPLAASTSRQLLATSLA